MNKELKIQKKIYNILRDNDLTYMQIKEILEQVDLLFYAQSSVIKP